MRKILWLSIIIYILAFGAVTILRHYNFQTQTGDMAIFVNALWNTVHGRWLQNTLEETSNTLGVHMSPILFLLAPLYWLFETPYTLLIIQTIAVALGAWPLYLLAFKILNNARLATAFAIGYLLYPGLEWANFYDFHPITFLPPLLLAGFYFAHERRWLPAGLFFALASATREDAILAVAATGIYFLIKNKACRCGHCEVCRGNLTFSLALTILAVIYFLISVKILMPHFGGGLLRIDRYAHLGDNATEIAKNLIIHPSLFFKTVFTGEKIAYVFWLLAPLGFLPLFAASEWLLIIPGLAENLLTNYRFQFSGLYQYDTILAGSLFIAAIYGARSLRGLIIISPWQSYLNVIKKNLSIILFSFAILGFLFRSPLKPLDFPVELFKSNPHWQTFRAILKTVPPEASVAAHTNLVPHLAHREKIYLLGREPAPVDMVIIDGADYFGFANPATLESYVDRYMSSGDYNLEVIKDRYFILRKK